MKICPKCKSEYRQGFEFCSDCNIKLISESEDTKEKINDDLDMENFLFLTNVADGCEINIIESLFESNEIIFLKKHKEAGEYLKISMGETSYGIDIYVERSQILKAKEILDDMQVDKTENKLTDEEMLDEKRYDRKRRLRIWLLLSIGFIPGIIFILFNLINELYYLITR